MLVQAPPQQEPIVLHTMAAAVAVLLDTWTHVMTQLSVLQTADEGKGPGAFQMLQYIKLQVDPQVCLLG